MKIPLRPLGAALAGLASALLVSSCYYDPYYGTTSISGSYSDGGYGYGYGYGSSRFSTSFFVSTGNSNWGYDPYCQSYYDYHRRAYYDPYLYGYYPVGYRPPVLVGCPHPYGYRPGRYCPPPRVIHYNTVPNYHNREHAYRSSNYDWARQVRQKPVVKRPEESRTGSSHRSGNWNHSQNRPSESKYQGRSPSSRAPQTNTRYTQSNSRPPQTSSSRSRQTYVNQRSEESRNPKHNTHGQGGSHKTKPQTSPPAKNQRNSEPRQQGDSQKTRKEESRNVRSLGQTRR